MMGKLAKVKTAVKIVAIMMTITLILMTRTTLMSRKGKG